MNATFANNEKNNDKEKRKKNVITVDSNSNSNSKNDEMKFNDFYKSQNINTIKQNSNTIKAKNLIASIKFFMILLTMSRVRFLTIKSKRTINWTRFNNQETCLIFIRKRKQKRSCQNYAANSKIFANCVAMTIFFKNFCTSCYYNFENDRCNFRFKFEIDSSSSRKRIRESKTKFVLSIIKRQTRRRNFSFFFFFFQKFANRD
jgi:hypothetical protein